MRQIYPKLRLHSALSDPHGIPVEQAVERATTEMAAFSDDAFVLVDAAIMRLREMCRLDPGDLDPVAVFTEAETVVDLAGLYTPPLCRAAQSLCDLAQKAMQSGSLDRNALTVHVETLLLLRSTDGKETPTTKAIIAGLLAVVAKAR
jgi:hypothetical protein